MERPYIVRFSSKIYEAITGAISNINSSPSVQTLNECESKSAALLQTIPRENEIVSLDTEGDSCSGCADPCSMHPNYPYLKIDRKSTLEGTVKPYVKHVLISTGKSDWQAHIEDDCCSLAAHLHKAVKNDNVQRTVKKDPSRKEKKEKKNKVEGSPQIQEDSSNEAEKPRIVITNSSRQNTDDDSKGNDILLFPDNILIRNVTPKQAAEFHKRFLSSVYDEKDQFLSTIGFTPEPMPYKSVIVICSHKRRDKRCGVTGPILKGEFDKVLKTKGLDVESCSSGGVAVFLSSHTGGHKFAGNVIVYREGQGIWYGRVIPCHVNNIIESTVLEGKVIKDLYRGSMNGSFAPGKGGKLEW